MVTYLKTLQKYNNWQSPFASGKSATTSGHSIAMLDCQESRINGTATPRLHGSGANADRWRNQVPRFTSRYGDSISLTGMIYDIWYMIYDIWYMIYDIWYDTVYIKYYNIIYSLTYDMIYLWKQVAYSHHFFSWFTLNAGLVPQYPQCGTKHKKISRIMAQHTVTVRMQEHLDHCVSGLRSIPMEGWLWSVWRRRFYFGIFWNILGFWFFRILWSLLFFDWFTDSFGTTL